MRKNLVASRVALILLATAASAKEPRVVRVVWDLYCGTGHGEVFYSLSPDAGTQWPPGRVPEDTCLEENYPVAGFKKFDSSSKRVIQPGDLVRLTTVGHNPISLRVGTPQVVRIEESDSNLAAGLRAILAIMGSRTISPDPAQKDVEKAIQSELTLAAASVRTLERQAPAVRAFGDLVGSAPKALAAVTLSELKARYQTLPNRSDVPVGDRLKERADALAGSLGKPGEQDCSTDAPLAVCLPALLMSAQSLVDRLEMTECAKGEAECGAVAVPIKRYRLVLADLSRNAQLDPKAPTVSADTLTRYVRDHTTHQKYLGMSDAQERWAYSTEVNVTAASVVPTKTERFFLSVPFETVGSDPPRSPSTRTLSLLVRPSEPRVIASLGALWMPGTFAFKKLTLRQLPGEGRDPVSSLATLDIDSPRPVLPLVLTSIRIARGFFMSLGTSTDKNFFKTGVAGVSWNLAKHKAVFTVGGIWARGRTQEDLAGTLTSYARVDPTKLDLAKIPLSSIRHARFFFGLSVTP